MTAIATTIIWRRLLEPEQNILAVILFVEEHRSTGTACKSAGGPHREIPWSYDQGTVQLSASI
jgi:hypothetical protein